MANLQHENLAEQLSALMDGEASEMELLRVLKQAAGDTELRGTWARYQMVSSLLRQQPVAPALSLSLADRVSQALESENAQTAVLPAAASGWQLSMKRFAVAASVAVVVIAGAQWQQSRTATPLQTAAAVAPTQPIELNAGSPLFAQSATAAAQMPPAMLAGKPMNASARLSPRQNAQFERYLQYHLERASVDAQRGMVPMAPTAIQERQ